MFEPKRPSCFSRLGRVGEQFVKVISLGNMFVIDARRMRRGDIRVAVFVLTPPTIVTTRTCQIR